MNRFHVKILCKPYVRRFIEINYGDPADITKDKMVYQFFCSRLKKKTFRYEKKYKKLDKYTDEIAIKISRDDFYRYGWEISMTDNVAFNRIMEYKVKEMLYKIVGIYTSIGFPLSESIDRFQEQYGFHEDVWPKESIRKDCCRNLNIDKKEIDNLISKIINTNKSVKKT